MNKIEIDLDKFNEDEKNQIIKFFRMANSKKTFKPELYETYYYIDNIGHIKYEKWSESKIDFSRYAIGNCFERIEEADAKIEYLKVRTELERFAEENNEEEIVWDNKHQCKFYIIYNFQCRKIDLDRFYTFKHNDIYFTSKEIAKKAIELIGEERLKKYYFGVSE